MLKQRRKAQPAVYIGGRHFLPGSAPAQGYQPAQLFLTGVRPFLAYPNLFRRR